jgi:hypothetical protein
MKREKRLTKRERKALAPPRPARAGGADDKHIHCVACGKHLNPHEFDHPATATRIACQHRAMFATCIACIDVSKNLLAIHDRTGQPVRAAAAWH